MRKKLQTLLTTIIFFTCTGIAQNVYTVNNSPNIPADYHTLQGAIDSVAPGSTLLLQASGQNYGGGIIRKPLAIYGAGYFLGQNNVPNTQAILAESMVAQIIFGNGSAGSIVSGLSFTPSQADPPGILQRLNFDSTSFITVSRCRIIHTNCGCPSHDFIATFNQSSIISIRQCYMDVAGSVMLMKSSSGISLTNNIIVGDINNPVNSSYSQAPFNYSFENNSFYGNMQFPDFTNGSFVNNVIIQSAAQTISIQSPMVFADHNVSNVNIFPGGGTNIINADGANTYTLFSNPAISSQDGILQLKAGSVAIGYGTGGIDCGAFGGSTYVLSGIPAIPNIYYANTQQGGTTTGGLKVHLKIKANN